MDELPEPANVELTAEDRAALDAMSPEQRHAAMDRIHARWVVVTEFDDALNRVAAAFDHLVEIMQPMLHRQPAEMRESYLDMLMGLGLQGEAVRALARRDKEAYADYRAAADRYFELTNEVGFHVMAPDADPPAV